MDDILDAIEKKNTSKKFSKFSFLVSLITLGLLSFIISYVPRNLGATDTLESPPLVVMYGLLISCLLGMMISIFSFYRKEPNSWYKWIGIILNMLVFIILVGSTIIAFGMSSPIKME